MKKVAVLFAVGLLVAIAGLVLPHQSAGASVKKPSMIRLIDPETHHFFCSAVVISPTRALTAAHCVVKDSILGVEIMPSVEVRSFDDADLHLSAKVIGVNGRMDQAAIEGDFSDFDQMPVEIRPAKLEEMFLKGHHIVACGFPMGGSPVCSDITNIHRMAFQFAGEGFLFPGMSGGPVIDADTGTVIGVNTAVQENGEVILSSAVEEWQALGIPPQ